MYLDLSTNTQQSINDYITIISSIYLPFSNAVINVNAIPGVCTLNSSVTNYNSSINGTYTNFPRVFSNYTAQTLSNSLALSSLSLFASNYTTQYTSAGVLALSTSFSVYGTLSSAITANTNYISSLLSPEGSIQASIQELFTLQANVLDILIPFAGSTIYYSMLETIPDYSTSVTAIPPLGEAHDPYLLRSTFFSSITTRLQTSYMSSIIASNVGVQIYSPSLFVLDVLGNTSMIQPTGGIPSCALPNFNIYASDALVSNISSMMVSARFSSIVFNEALVIQRIYNNQRFGLVGINTTTPSYSLDIGIGDARKPSGTTWITASDQRVKTQLSDPKIDALVSQISDIRLKSFTWSSEFCRNHGVYPGPTLGFISQEVQPIFPMAVVASAQPENGFSQFLSLDTDQLMKSKFAVTQHLLHRVSSLTTRINTLLKES